MSAAPSGALPLKRPSSIADVIDGWEAFGPLVHHATTFPTLDRLTGGGPVFGTRWYVMGAPDACKTLFLSMLADVWSHTLVVGMLAVDEEPEDLAMRFIQRRQFPQGGFFQRIHCEQRDPVILDAMRVAVGDGGVLLFGPEWTIEEAAFYLSEMAKEQGTHAALMVDSVQTVECNELRKDLRKEINIRERLGENVKAIRACATKYKMIIVASSEMNRAAYKTIKSDQNDMAAAAESRAVEYSARVMMALRNYPDEPDCIELKVIKNKHGQSVPVVESIYLHLMRAQQVMQERPAPESATGGNLADELLDALGDGPMTTEALRKALSVKRERVEEAMKAHFKAGRVKRIGGSKSPWKLLDVDPEGDDIP